MDSIGTVLGTVTINGGAPLDAVMTLTQEMIEYQSRIATKHDPAWAFADAAGHFHAYDQEGKLPTVEVRSEDKPCDDSCGGACGGEGYVETHRHCLLCGEEIEPGRLPDNYGVMPGRTSCELKVYGLVPAGRASFHFFAAGGSGKEWFGFGETVGSQGGFDSQGRDRTTTDVVLWPVGQRTVRHPAAAL